MDPNTIFFTLVILAIGACVGWWAHDRYEEYGTVYEFEDDDGDDV